jgi:hypothetical protein
MRSVCWRRGPAIRTLSGNGIYRTAAARRWRPLLRTLGWLNYPTALEGKARWRSLRSVHVWLVRRVNRGPGTVDCDQCGGYGVCVRPTAQPEVPALPVPMWQGGWQIGERVYGAGA